MRGRAVITACLLAAPVGGCPAPAGGAQQRSDTNHERGQAMQGDTIGSATMREDGTLVLQLRAVTGATVGDGYLTYAPTDPNYQAVLDHLGGLEPGQSKPVPPWPEDD